MTDHKYSRYLDDLVELLLAKGADCGTKQLTTDKTTRFPNIRTSNTIMDLKITRKPNPSRSFGGELLGEGADYVTKQLTPDCTRRFPSSLSLHIQSWGLKREGRPNLNLPGIQR